MFKRVFLAVLGATGLLFMLAVFSASTTAIYLSNVDNAVNWLTARGYWVSATGETWSGTSLIPSVNNTYTVGNSTRQWAEGWFNIIRSINGVFTTLNATQLTATTGNITTLNLPDSIAGGLYMTDDDNTVWQLIRMGRTSVTYGYQSGIYFGLGVGNSSSNASFQGAFGINTLRGTDNLSEGNWAFGDAIFELGTNLTYNIAIGDGPGRYASNSTRLTIIGDHAIYNAAGFAGRDMEVIGGGTAGNLTSGYQSQIIGRGAAGKINDIRNSVVIGYNAANNIPDRIWNAIIIGSGAGNNISVSQGLDSKLWIGDGNNGVTPIIFGHLPTTNLTFNANFILANGNMTSNGTFNMANKHIVWTAGGVNPANSTTHLYETSASILVVRNGLDNDYGTLKGKINFVSDIGTTGNAAFHTASDNNSWITFQALTHGGALTTVAALRSGTTPFFELTTAPKFATNSISGPSGNVTPVSWATMLLADNTTGYFPIYK